ncbi:MAG: cupin domain-containing protein [Rhodobacterales bacterium]
MSPPESVDLFVEDRARVLMTTLEQNQRIATTCHIHACKQITILDGYAEVELPEACLKLYEGQTAFIPSGTAHEIVNLGKIPLKYVEIRTGPYVMDDDQLA